MLNILSIISSKLSLDSTFFFCIFLTIYAFAQCSKLYCCGYRTWLLLLQSVAVSGAAAVSGNNLGGRVELDYFSFTLKWSRVGKLHTVLVQVILLNYIFMLSSCLSYFVSQMQGLQLHTPHPLSKFSFEIIIARGKLW